MIAKVIAYGRDRSEALGRLRRALAETTVVIEGGATNKSFVLDLLGQPEVIARHRGYRLDRPRPGRGPPWRSSALGRRPGCRRDRGLPGRGGGQHAAAAGHRAWRASPGAARSRPSARPEAPRRRLPRARRPAWPAAIPGRDLRRRRPCTGPTSSSSGLTRYSGRIVVNGRRFRLITATHGPIHLVEVDGVAHRVSLDEGGVVRSPAPALVVATPLAAGDEVEANAPVLVLESMKMETVLRAPFRARVKECLVSVGSQVDAGAPLLRLEPVAGRGRLRRTSPAGGQTAEIDLRRFACGRSRDATGSALPGRPARPAARLRRRRRRPRRLLAGWLAARGRARRAASYRASRSCSPFSPTCRN